jgi:hypothetical protein
MTRVEAGVSQARAWGIECAICRVVDDRLRAVNLAGPGDTLVLVVRAARGIERRGSPPALDVELWRGGRRRGGQSIDGSVLAAEPHAVCFRLQWGDCPWASTRLMGRVLVAGEEVARAEVLLGRPAFDGQGRIQAPDDRPTSDHTLLAFARGLARLAGSEDF